MSIILILSLGSCEEGKNILSPHSENTGMYSPGANSMPSWVANTSNPYDNYGEMYSNIALYYFQNTNYLGLDYDTAWIEYKAIRLNYLAQYKPLGAIDYVSMNNIDCAKEYDCAALYQYSYVEDALSLLISSGIASNTELGAQNFINGIKNIESQVLLDASLDPAVKQEILISTSRLRYNTIFMLDQLRDPNSELNVIIDSRYAANDGDTTIINLPITIPALEHLWRIKCEEAALSPEETRRVIEAVIYMNSSFYPTTKKPEKENTD